MWPLFFQLCCGPERFSDLPRVTQLLEGRLYGPPLEAFPQVMQPPQQGEPQSLWPVNSGRATPDLLEMLHP